MFEAVPSVATTPSDDDAVENIVRAGPRGAITLAGIATALVVLMWFAFYLLVFVPRGIAQ